MGKRPFKLKENGIPIKIISDVENKIKRTVKEYAEKYDTSEAYIRDIIRTLKKRGYWWIGIIGYKPGIGDKCQAGRIVDLREKQTYFLENKERQNQQALFLVSAKFRFAERAYEFYDDLKLEIEAMADDLQRKIIDHKAQLRLANGQNYGDKESSN